MAEGEKPNEITIETEIPNRQQLFWIRVYQIAFWFLKTFLVLIHIPARTLETLRKHRNCPAPTNKLLQQTAAKLAQLIREKKITSEAVLMAYIQRINSVNPIINAVVEDRYEAALEDAKRVDEFVRTTDFTPSELADKYPLLGVPLTVKSSIAVMGMGLNAGISGRHVTANMDAACVKNARSAGAIPLVTSNVPEMCLNLETANKTTGITRNPYDDRKTVGGSSGGEAALIAAAASVIGIGSDLGGSLRIPAHFCGIWSHKPSPGLVSFEGHFPSCSMQEEWLKVFTLGPMSRYATDLRFFLKILMQNHSRNLTNLDQKIPLKDINVFYVESFDSCLIPSLQPDIQRALQKTVKYLRKSSRNKCVKVNYDLLNYTDCFFLLRMSQIKGIDNLFNGRGDGAVTELFKYLVGRSRHDIIPIAYGLLNRYPGLYRKRILAIMTECLDRIRSDLRRLLADDGVLVLPSFLAPANTHHGIYGPIMGSTYMSTFNLIGFPVTNCPVAYTADRGLPIGIQVVAAPNCDHLTLAVAEELERAFGGWTPPGGHTKNPQKS